MSDEARAPEFLVTVSRDRSFIPFKVIGYQLYQERQKTTGIEINVGKSGISIEKK